MYNLHARVDFVDATCFFNSRRRIVPVQRMRSLRTSCFVLPSLLSFLFLRKIYCSGSTRYRRRFVCCEIMKEKAYHQNPLITAPRKHRLLGSWFEMMI
jgi:hypothetical protein